ncbi:MAG: ester cyclase, partial [Ktedonobacteraceae bacterium]|nr:ester cyclase [Ktedonobacteraceae bacterium]
MSMFNNKAFIRRYYHEILEQRNTILIDEIFSPAFLAYPSLGPAYTLQEYKTALATSHYALEDIHVTVDDQIAEEDKVVTRWRATATHQGTFFGVPATGKTVTTSA